MNGTFETFPYADENGIAIPNSSRDMMNIRNIMDTISNANSDNEEEPDSAPIPGNRPSDNTEESQQISLESISESSQKAEQMQAPETEPERQPEHQEKQQFEQQQGQHESSQGRKPEQQSEPAPTPAPVINDGSIIFRHLPDATNIDQTPFANKIDLVADYQDSAIILRSDETYGAASNLIKTVATPAHTNVQHNEEDEFRDGWLVKRHEDVGYATIRLGVAGTIRGIDIDCTGYTQCAPLHASVHGYLRRTDTDWTALVDRVPLIPNSHNFFEIVNNTEVHTHVHFAVSPGGGVARLRCYGDIPKSANMGNMEFNMASSKVGAEIVQKPANIVRGEFPNLIINRKESSHDGWISPRVQGVQTEESEFTIIKLVGKAEIDRIAVDTVHFIGNAPKKVILEGCCITASQEGNNADSDALANAEWKNLIAEKDIFPNSYNTLPCIYNGPITHVRYRPVPNGGVQQILVKGSFFGTRVAIPQSQHKPKHGPHKKRKRIDESEFVNDENDSRRKSSRIKRPVSRYQ
ncbi:hypothetical protein PS15p_206876 [Mucor circinelloides]